MIKLKRFRKAGGQSLQDINHDPIIVYAMGKVATQTVELSLKKAYVALALDVPIYYTHTLNRLETNKSPFPAMIKHIKQAKVLRAQIDADTNQHWNIVSLVRDPVARNVADFFQNLNLHIPHWKKLLSRGRLGHEEVKTVFLQKSFHKIPANWFDNQIKPVFGIDVYELPFPTEIGYKIYANPPRASLLLMRLENIGYQVNQAMFEFLGLKDFILASKNIGESKDYAPLYKVFKEGGLPRSYVESMYSTKFARHFYSQAELENFGKYWIKEDS